MHPSMKMRFQLLENPNEFLTQKENIFRKFFNCTIQKRSQAKIISPPKIRIPREPVTKNFIFAVTKAKLDHIEIF